AQQWYHTNGIGSRRSAMPAKRVDVHLGSAPHRPGWRTTEARSKGRSDDGARPELGARGATIKCASMMWLNTARKMNTMLKAENSPLMSGAQSEMLV
ncbi:hypothetical protein FS837_008381, partial [Tulasnella sp. UAMH 9824]